MSNTTYKTNENKMKYSNFLSSLFCSTSVLILSILSILNNMIIDAYSIFLLLKIVLPASISFWIIGYIIGSILDNYGIKITEKEMKNEQKAYEIPSMFTNDIQATSNPDNIEDIL